MGLFPSITKEWHSQPYQAIDPTRPELAIWSGKVIVITGGGGSIGRATALAFAQAGSPKIAIVGRRSGPLEETKSLIESKVPGAEVLPITGDVADLKSISTALTTISQRLGKVDVLVANAAYLSKFSPIADADPDDWWQGFITNTHGAFNLARAFLPNAATNPTIVDVSSCVVHVPALPTASSYVASKMASTKIWETFGVENPHVHIVHMHPGVVESDLNLKSGIPANDSADLPGHFAVWLVSPEAKNFRGKYLWCNWDVSELLDRQDELSQQHQLSITMNGYPWGWEGTGNEALEV